MGWNYKELGRQLAKINSDGKLGELSYEFTDNQNSRSGDLIQFVLTFSNFNGNMISFIRKYTCSGLIGDLCYIFQELCSDVNSDEMAIKSSVNVPHAFVSGIWLHEKDKNKIIVEAKKLITAYNNAKQVNR